MSWHTTSLAPLPISANTRASEWGRLPRLLLFSGGRRAGGGDGGEV